MTKKLPNDESGPYNRARLVIAALGLVVKLLDWLDDNHGWWW